MTRKPPPFKIRLGAILLVSATACLGPAWAADQPNVIVILADDLGYGDVSCYGATAIHTPNIDRLATEGLRFTGGYCSASTCTPTRYSLLTGTDAFFLYYAPHDIHVPRMPHERFQGQSSLGWRGDAILELDWGVGEILKTLDRLNIADRTLIVFSSDNGPVLDDGYKDDAVGKLGDHKPAGPFSGGKYTIQEGGTRVPFITRWPGRIQPGVSDEIVCTIDLAASLAALTGAALPDGACLDSFNVLDALLGAPGAKGRDHLLEQNNGGGNFGLRVGDWKLQRHGRGRKQAAAAREDELFDLATDPGEKNNVAGEHPEVRDRLAAQLQAIISKGRTRNL